MPATPIGGLANGAVLSNQYAASGVTFVPNFFSGSGGPTGPWATNTDMTIVTVGSSAAGAVGTPSLVSGHILRSFDNYLNENGDPSFSAVFSVPIYAFFADFAGVRTPSSVRPVRVQRQHAGRHHGPASSSAQQFTLGFTSAVPITRVAITPGDFDDWVGVDNIRFVIPEPSTYALAGIALVACGAAKRRRTQQAAGTGVPRLA